MLLKKSKIILETLISQPSASSIHSYLGIKDFLIPLLEEKMIANGIMIMYHFYYNN